MKVQNERHKIVFKIETTNKTTLSAFSKSAKYYYYGLNKYIKEQKESQLLNSKILALREGKDIIVATLIVCTSTNNRISFRMHPSYKSV
jgi:hypothetical protein